MSAKQFFTKAEDQLIVETVSKMGLKEALNELEKSIKRPKRRIRERYINSLDPRISHVFTERDDIELIKLVNLHGKHWSVISKILLNKSSNDCKARFQKLLSLMKDGKIERNGKRNVNIPDKPYVRRTSVSIETTEKLSAFSEATYASPHNETNDEFDVFFDHDLVVTFESDDPNMDFVQIL